MSTPTFDLNRDTAPFDLEQALAGHPLCSRLGEPRSVTLIPDSDNLIYPLEGWAVTSEGSQKFTYTRDGRHFLHCDSTRDLFLDLRPDRQIEEQANDPTVNDPVNRPAHYTSHPSGVECIQITEHMSFCLGNTIKYIWRAGLKKEDPVEDLRKARYYLDREIERFLPKPKPEPADKQDEQTRP